MGACHKACDFSSLPRMEPVSVPGSGIAESPRKSLHTHLMYVAFSQTISLYDSFLAIFYMHPQNCTSLACQPSTKARVF